MKKKKLKIKIVCLIVYGYKMYTHYLLYLNNNKALKQ